MATIGRLIASARVTAGMHRQAELADAIGVSPATVSRWERDLVRPSLERIHQIAAATGMTPSYFVGQADSRGELSQDPTSDIIVARDILERVLSTTGTTLAQYRGEQFQGIQELLADAALCSALQVTQHERHLLANGYNVPVGPATKQQAVRLLQTLRDMSAHIRPDSRVDDSEA